MTVLLASARVRHTWEVQAPAGGITEFSFVARGCLELGAAGAVHGLDVFVLPRALARRIPSCGSPARHRSSRVVKLGIPVLDIDQCWLWLPLRQEPGLVCISGPAEVAAHVDDEKLLSLDVQIRPEGDETDNEEGEHGQTPPTG
ncbi:hypothetical protein GCM10009854_48190 [Saccharopolyspora halophila]|uniref:Uncharacterized protein n=1 Tax=Saccharopolyspora halophila TaxID=405551 RepID=A0ABN3GWM1_9PSEU